MFNLKRLAIIKLKILIYWMVLLVNFTLYLIEHSNGHINSEEKFIITVINAFIIIFIEDPRFKRQKRVY
ncbi:hypothetical protein G4D64_15795 [Bacillus sp. 3H-10]|nr:hypothetical protein [Bacillus aquiflavi]